jgi:hypothetical protein
MRSISMKAAVAVLTLALATSALAQQPAPAPTPAPATPPAEPPPGQRQSLLPPGMMIGPGMMRGGIIQRLCDPRGLGLQGWRIARLERVLNLTDEQKKKLEDLATASAKAVDQFVADCPRDDLPLTPTGRLEMLEARLTAALEGLRTVRSSFDAFYDSLNDEQKARLTPTADGRGWRFDRDGDRDRDRDRRRGRGRD